MPLFVPQPVNTDLLTHPVPAVAATMPLNRAVAQQGAMTSGILYVTSLGMDAGTPVSSCTMFTNVAAKTGGTHGWYVLLDNTRTVVAVTADQTDAATVWGATSTGYPLPWAAPYTATYTGRYYVGVMVAESAGTMPTFSGATPTTGGIVAGTGVSGALAYAGSSSTGQTTPPTLGTQMTAITPGATFLLYAYLT